MLLELIHTHTHQTIYIWTLRARPQRAICQFWVGGALDGRLTHVSPYQITYSVSDWYATYPHIWSEPFMRTRSFLVEWTALPSIMYTYLLCSLLESSTYRLRLRRGRAGVPKRIFSHLSHTHTHTHANFSPMGGRTQLSMWLPRCADNVKLIWGYGGKLAVRLLMSSFHQSTLWHTLCTIFRPYICDQIACIKLLLQCTWQGMGKLIWWISDENIRRGAWSRIPSH